MALPKTDPVTVTATSKTEPTTATPKAEPTAPKAEPATATSKAEPTATKAEPTTATPKAEPTTQADLGQVLEGLVASMREIQASVRADRERIEAIQLANGMVIRQGEPAEVPPTTPPDDSYVDPAQFDPSNFDFKI